MEGLRRWIIVAALMAVLLSAAQALECYACSSMRSNEECNKNVLDCDEISTPTLRYDTCQTRITKTEGRNPTIHKRCTVGPCTLGKNQAIALAMECDRRDSNWVCEQCCKEDRCNINAAVSPSPRTIILITLLSAVYIPTN